MLDGATGEVHFSIDHPLASTGTPAIGDIDHDGLVGDRRRGAADLGEPVRSTGLTSLPSRTTEPSLGVPTGPVPTSGIDAVALADMDADGDVEIIVKAAVLDHEGRVQWFNEGQGLGWDAPTAADLDGDGSMELVYGSMAFRLDGSEYYALPADENGIRDTGFPQGRRHRR